MDVTDSRRANLLDLITSYGTIAKLAAETGTNPAYLSQIKNKTRGMGRAVARQIEGRLKLTEGWMDTRDHTPAQGSIEQAALLADFRKLPPVLQSHITEKTAELVALWEQIPALVRPLITTPPSDPERYREWEGAIKALIESEKARQQK